MKWLHRAQVFPIQWHRDGGWVDPDVQTPLQISAKPLNSFLYRGGLQERHFNFFLGGQNFFKFFNATGLLKNWKKQHFICSNLTLCIVPYLLSFIFSFFLFFLFFFLFFLFFFSWGSDGPPAPLKWRPWWVTMNVFCDISTAQSLACWRWNQWS